MRRLLLLPLFLCLLLVGCPDGSGNNGGGDGFRAATPGLLPDGTSFYLEANDLQSLKKKLLELEVLARPKELDELLSKGWEKLLDSLDEHREAVESILQDVDHVRLGLTELTWTDPKRPPKVKAICFLGSEKLDEIRALLEEGGIQFKKAGEPVGETTIYGFEKGGPVSFYVAQKKGEIIGTTNRQLLVETLKAMDSGGLKANSLARNEQFQKVTEGMQDATIWGWYDTKPLESVMKMAMEREGTPPDVDMEDLEEIMELLGYQNSMAAYSSRIEKGRVHVETRSVLTSEEPNELWSLMVQEPAEMTLTRVAPEGSLFYLGFHLSDPVELYRQGVAKLKKLEKKMKKMQKKREGPTVDEAIARAEKELGLSIDEDILACFRGEFGIFWAPSEEGSYRMQDLVCAVTVDEKKVAALYEKLEASGALDDVPERTTEKLEDGTVVYVEERDFRPGYLLGKGRLLLGADKNVLKALHTSEGPALAVDPVFKEATTGYPEKVSKLAYINGAVLASAIVHKIEQDQGQAAVRIARSNLRSIGVAQRLHKLDKGAWAADLKTLKEEKYLDRLPGDNFYTYEVTRTQHGNWMARATPRDGKDPHLYVDESGVVRVSDDGPANEKSPPYSRRSSKLGPDFRLSASLHDKVTKWVVPGKTGIAIVSVEGDKEIRSHMNLPVAVSALVIGPAIVIPNLIESRTPANETAAIGSLKTIVTAQALFRERGKAPDGERRYAKSLAELGETNLIDSVLSGGTKSGYRFRILQSGDDEWAAKAEPLKPGQTGERWFYADETGVIRMSKDPDIGPESRPID